MSNQLPQSDSHSSVLGSVNGFIPPPPSSSGEQVTQNSTNLWDDNAHFQGAAPPPPPPASFGPPPVDPHTNPAFGPVFPWYSRTWLKWCTPSRKNGVKYEEETSTLNSSRAFIWELLQNLRKGNKYGEMVPVSVSAVTISSIYTYFALFFARISTKTFHPREVALVCVYLACKMFEPAHIHIRYLYHTVFQITHRKYPPNEAFATIETDVTSVDGMQYDLMLRQATLQDVNTILSEAPNDFVRYLLRRAYTIEALLLDVVEFQTQPHDVFQMIDTMLRDIATKWLEYRFDQLDAEQSKFLDDLCLESYRTAEAMLRISNMVLSHSLPELAVACVHTSARYQNSSAKLAKPQSPPWYTSIVGVPKEVAEPIMGMVAQCRKQTIKEKSPAVPGSGIKALLG